MTQTKDNSPAINNTMIRQARDIANRTGIAYIGDYNLGRLCAIPESHERGGVYLFPGRDNGFFVEIDLTNLEGVLKKIDSEPGTLKTLIDKVGSRVYKKQ